MMEGLKTFFSQVKWYEWLYMPLFICTIIVLGCVFKAGALVIFNSLSGILTVFFLAKGKMIGNVLGVIQSVFYIVISYFNAFYGEVLLCCCITIPIYIASIISWARNLNSKDKIVKVNKSLGWVEWVVSILSAVVISIGIYFLLDFFNTANLLVSTLSVFSCLMAGYLVVRRSEYNFVFYILNNIVCICLWVYAILQNNELGYITTIVQYCMFLILNIFGVFNWIKIKKVQRLRKLVLKKKSGKLIMDKDFMKL